MGDPFQGMTLRGGSKKAGPDGSTTVVGGSLVVANWGGSRQRWAHSFTLAWRKGRFVVAGFDNYLEDILDPGSLRETSVNLLSGRFTRKKGAKEGAPKRHPNRPFPADDCGSIDTLITAFSP